jgi:5-methylcytosine-specific restriction endonuclease McrA
MPIRPENRQRYPENWKEIRAAILRRAGNRCEECGLHNHSIGTRHKDGTFRNPYPGQWDIYHDNLRSHHSKQQALTAAGLIMIVLTIAHLDHQPENVDPANLKSLCQKCHNRYDATNRRKGIRERQHEGQLRLPL